MKPLQVWLPELASSRAGAMRDRERALRAWQGELRVWLLPDAQRVYRWRDEDFFGRFVTVPAEEFNSVGVYHVSDTGLTYGQGSSWRFRNGRIDGLLDEWLNCSSVSLYPAPTSVLFNDV